ncbi:hypothetical protein GGU10DRAFT_365631 [Lentinula aff. detonsa]|uniref:Secreted protein n=1 Tax=Lentinula aff. detonsa TaxID=2804958 RepID=A0AA38L2C0_9AGAR|nr:hypothetical protein GGU10DRAFT_365631 [Lentinula aff. detonsa]
MSATFLIMTFLCCGRLTAVDFRVVDVMHGQLVNAGMGKIIVTILWLEVVENASLFRTLNVFPSGYKRWGNFPRRTKLLAYAS